MGKKNKIEIEIDEDKLFENFVEQLDDETWNLFNKNPKKFMTTVWKDFLKYKKSEIARLKAEAKAEANKAGQKVVFESILEAIHYFLNHHYKSVLKATAKEKRKEYYDLKYFINHQDRDDNGFSDQKMLSILIRNNYDVRVEGDEYIISYPKT